MPQISHGCAGRAKSIANQGKKVPFYIRTAENRKSKIANPKRRVDMTKSLEIRQMVCVKRWRGKTWTAIYE